MRLTRVPRRGDDGWVLDGGVSISMTGVLHGLSMLDCSVEFSLLAVRGDIARRLRLTMPWPVLIEYDRHG